MSKPKTMACACKKTPSKKAATKSTSRGESCSVKVGQILSGRWGYDETHASFAQVVKAGPGMIGLRMMGNKQSGSQAVPGAVQGPVFNRKLSCYRGEPSVRLNSYTGLSPWDGRPQHEDNYTGWSR